MNRAAFAIHHNKTKNRPSATNTGTAIHIRRYANLKPRILYHLRKQLASGTFVHVLAVIFVPIFT